MMLVNENEVIPFQKSPWNALRINGILLKNTPFFKTKFYSLSMLKESLGYAINKYGRFYRVPDIIVIFKKIKNYKI